MKKWEYKIMYRRRDKSIIDQLHELGTKGWELVTVTSRYGYYLKRPMCCENCRFYEKVITHISRTGGVFSDVLCKENPNDPKSLSSSDGCGHFKSKEND